MKTPETRGGILVVDDEENIRSLLKLTLEEAGYKVDSASNGLEAVQRMSECSFDPIGLLISTTIALGTGSLAAGVVVLARRSNSSSIDQDRS